MARKIIESAASTSYGQDLQKIGKTRVKFSDNLEIQQIMRACVDMADSNLSNITQTLGMISPTGAALPLQSLYREVCDFAFNLTSTGSASYTRSIELACDRLD